VCLSRVDRRSEGTYDEKLEARIYWKAMVLDQGKLHSLNYDRNRAWRPGKWYKASVGSITYPVAAESLRAYPQGFHAFFFKKDAKDWDQDSDVVYVKVRLRGVHTVGVQSGRYPAVVAYEQMILTGQLLRKRRKRRGR
jgi:hypothetical protein